MAAAVLVAWVALLDGPVRRRSADAEEFGQLGLGVGAEIVQLKQVLGLVRLQLRLLASQPSFRLSDLHASRVRILIRSATNSATIASTLNSSVLPGLSDHGLSR